MRSLPIKTSNTIVPFKRVNSNITAPSASIMMDNKYGFVLPILEGYSFPQTCIHHTLLLNKYVLVSIGRYLSI